MRKQLAATAVLCLFSAPALAQNTTAVGTGVGTSEATSVSGAVAISGQGGNANSTSIAHGGTGIGVGGNATGGSATGGAGGAGGAGGQGGRGGRASATSTGSSSGSNSSLSITNPANTTSTLNQNVSGTTTSNINQRVSGTTTVKTAPSVVAPGLAAAGLETCLGSASGTVSAIGFGIGGGSTYVDPGCEARLDARTLASWGLKAAAVARICQQPKVWNSMPDVCAQYWPRGMPVPYGVAVVEPVGYGGANIRMSASGGSVKSIRVINGKTGVESDCLNYSATKQKCYQWAGEPTVTPRKRVANVQTPQRIVVKPKPTGEKPKIEPPKVEPTKAAEPENKS